MSVLVSRTRPVPRAPLGDPRLMPESKPPTASVSSVSAPNERRRSRARKPKEKLAKGSRTRRCQRSKSTPAVLVDDASAHHELGASKGRSMPLSSVRLPSLGLSKSLTKLGMVQQQQWQQELQRKQQQQQQQPSQQQQQQQQPRRRRPSLSPEKSVLSLSSIVNENANPASAGGKKAKKPSLLSSVKPDNVEEEKEKFMRSRYTYNPQFYYKTPASEETLERFGKVSANLLPMAKQILRTALRKHGSFERFMERTGGRRLNRVEIMDVVRKYLQEEGLDKEISVQLSDTMVPHACMTRVRGQPTLQVKVGDIREFWVDGMLRHEIGTHYARSRNNHHQIWQNSRKRRQLELLPLNPTEEGLASLHSVIYRPEPCMWRSACLYYTVYVASQMSFADTFRDLSQFIKDPDARWDYCVRAKRGMTDTSYPGAFNKDQVYLKGSLDILKHRHEIDFELLLRCGKVCFHDLDKLRDIVNVQKTTLPKFMLDMKKYRRALDDILEKNGLTDEDLDDIA